MYSRALGLMVLELSLREENLSHHSSKTSLVTSLDDFIGLFCITLILSVLALHFLSLSKEVGYHFGLNINICYYSLQDAYRAFLAPDSYEKIKILLHMNVFSLPSVIGAIHVLSSLA